MKLSQNFLNDLGAIAAIIEAVKPRTEDNILEIGPGRGAITQGFIENGNCISAIELDENLVDYLKTRYGSSNLRIKRGDILKTDLSTYGRNIRLVGNLPYHISSPILFHVSKFFKYVRDAHFMLQREVVNRMVAGPGESSYGRLSVMLQYHWTMEKLFDLSPKSFLPSPKVWSSVIRMIPRKNHDFAVSDYGYFESIVANAFSQRRKMLKSSLKKIIDYSDIAAAGINPTLRAENLSVTNFVDLANKTLPKNTSRF